MATAAGTSAQTKLNNHAKHKTNVLGRAISNTFLFGYRFAGGWVYENAYVKKVMQLEKLKNIETASKQFDAYTDSVYKLFLAKKYGLISENVYKKVVDLNDLDQKTATKTMSKYLEDARKIIEGYAQPQDFQIAKSFAAGKVSLKLSNGTEINWLDVVNKKVELTDELQQEILERLFGNIHKSDDVAKKLNNLKTHIFGNDLNKLPRMYKKYGVTNMDEAIKIFKAKRMSKQLGLTQLTSYATLGFFAGVFSSMPSGSNIDYRSILTGAKTHQRFFG